MRPLFQTPNSSFLTPPSDERKRRLAFTLIEMLIVISIISILLGLLYGAIERAQKFSRRTITYTELKSIESAFKQYYAYYHAWPSNAVASVQLTTSEGDTGFIIDQTVAQLLQGHILNKADNNAIAFNPEAIPFIEFSRYSAATRAPVNPFKSNKSGTDDTSRNYKVIFDTNGDRQILIAPDTTDAPGTTEATNIIASVAVWTVIPATRQTTTSGQAEGPTEVMFGSWEPFRAK